MKTTQAFILGAGLGTRLRPLTDNLPKPLVPFFHEPLIVHTMRQCKAAGISRFIINTHFKPEAWVAAFPHGEWEGCEVLFSHEPTILGTGGGLRKVLPLIDADAPLLVLNGDILSTILLNTIIEHHVSHQAGLTLGLRSTGHLCNVAYDSTTSKISDIRNSLGIHQGNMQSTGIYCIDPQYIGEIPENENHEIIPLYIELIKREIAFGVMVNTGVWLDLGTPKAYIEAHMLHQSSSPRIHCTASIASSARVSDTCVIGRRAVISDRCNLTGCIVWQGVCVPPDTVAKNQVFI